MSDHPLHKARRERIMACAQECVDGDESTAGGVVIGAVLIYETMAPTGERWLSVSAPGASGDELPKWTVHGYLHNLLHDPGWMDQVPPGDDAGG